MIELYNVKYGKHTMFDAFMASGGPARAAGAASQAIGTATSPPALPVSTIPPAKKAKLTHTY